MHNNKKTQQVNETAPCLDSPTKGLPARFYRTGATSTPTLHTAWPQRRRLGTSHQMPRPRLQPPLPGAALPPSPGPPVPAQLPLLRKPESRGVAAPGGARATSLPTPQQPDPRAVPATPERAKPRKPLRATGWPRERSGGREAVTCRGLGRSTPAPLSWQPRQLHGGRKPKGLVTAPSVHRAGARAHAGVDVEGPGSPPPVRFFPPSAG